MRKVESLFAVALVATLTSCGSGGGGGSAGGSASESSPNGPSAPNTWVWMGGSNSSKTSNPVYGTRGTPSSFNSPGARTVTTYWTDSFGNFWLFGGLCTSCLAIYANDLWVYNPSAGTWTWVSGSADANSSDGTKGNANASNVPPGQFGTTSWIDAAGNLWLFGGEFEASGSVFLLNDLWEYSPSTGTWTWVSGDSTTNSSGIYGTLGKAAASNLPGARWDAAYWTDSSGNFWLFGGDGYDANGTWSELNDLWEYNPSTGAWTWVSGSNSANASGT